MPRQYGGPLGPAVTFHKALGIELPEVAPFNDVDYEAARQERAPAPPTPTPVRRAAPPRPAAAPTAAPTPSTASLGVDIPEVA